jgi:hypothetical protein
VPDYREYLRQANSSAARCGSLTVSGFGNLPSQPVLNPIHPRCALLRRIR